jgi:hypothetical protein
MRLFRRRAGLTTAAVFLALAAPAAGAPLTVEIVNNSGKDPSDIWLSLFNGPSTDGKMPDNTPVTLASLGSSSSFQLGDISAGRLFVSYGEGATQFTSTSSPIRNDKIEFTNPGVADLTAVDFFAIPMDIQTLDSSDNVLESLAFRCYTQTINSKLLALPGGPSGVINNAQGIAKILSPQMPGTNYPLMTDYIASMAGKTITVDSQYDGWPGAPGGGYPPAQADMTGTFQSDGSITLSGTITPAPQQPAPGQSTPSTTGNQLVISGDSMAAAVYSNNGTYTKNGVAGQVGDNDVWAVIYRDVVAGFALGYWGGKYGNSSSAWLRQPAFANAWTTPPSFTPYYHQYGALITEFSDAYGFPFTDLSPYTVHAGLGAQVTTMRVIINPDTGPNVPGCVGASTPSTPTTPTTPTTPDPANPPAVNPAPPSSSTPATTAPPKRTKTGRASAIVERSSARLDKNGRLILPVRCDGDPCRGELELVAKERVKTKAKAKSRAKDGKGRDKAKERKPKTRLVTVGRATVVVHEGETERLVVKLTKEGRALLKRAGRRGLVTDAVVELGPRSKPTTVSIRRVKVLPYVKAKPKRGGHDKHR